MPSVQPHSSPTNSILGSFLTEQTEGASKAQGVTFGSHNYEWDRGQLDQAVTLDFLLPNIITRACTSKPYCIKSSDPPELCKSWRGRRKYVSVPEEVGFLNVHHGNPTDMYLELSADVAKIHHFPGIALVSARSAPVHCPDLSAL